MGLGAGACPIGRRRHDRRLLGASETFDDAIGEFAVEYADQNQRDYRAFIRAIRAGRIAVVSED